MSDDIQWALGEIASRAERGDTAAQCVLALINELARRPEPSGGTTPIRATTGEQYRQEDESAPCSNCGNEERTAAGYLTCECPASGGAPSAPAGLRAFEIHICDDCYVLKGEMCHNAECIFVRRTMAEVSELLDTLLIRPIVDGERLDLHPLTAAGLPDRAEPEER